MKGPSLVISGYTSQPEKITVSRTEVVGGRGGG